MRRPVALLALALLTALVAATGTAGAAFTTHEENRQTITAGVIEEPVQLVAQSQSADGGAGMAIDYGLRLRNLGTEGIDLARVTMRYWFTADNSSANPVAQCYYATYGCNRIQQHVTDLPGRLDDADHYVKVVFENGSLGPGLSAPLEQLAIRDPYGADYSESNDYSFLPNPSFIDNPHVTVYIDGELVWGTEPAPLPDVESVEVQYANLDFDPRDPAIKFNLKVLNTGTVDIAPSRLKIRYWFTRDGGSTTLDGYCDYTQFGCHTITTSFGEVSPAKPTADRYLVVGFANRGPIEAGTDSGQVQLRIHKSDFSPFDEHNDYSHGSNTAFATTLKLTAYLDGQLIWGTEP